MGQTHTKRRREFSSLDSLLHLEAPVLLVPTVASGQLVPRQDCSGDGEGGIGALQDDMTSDRSIEITVRSTTL